jgi:hypothetical protein
MITLMMEAVRTSETSVNSYQSTRRYNPEDGHLHSHRCENLKSYLNRYHDYVSCILFLQLHKERLRWDYTITAIFGMIAIRTSLSAFSLVSNTQREELLQRPALPSTHVLPDPICLPSPTRYCHLFLVSTQGFCDISCFYLFFPRSA